MVNTLANHQFIPHDGRVMTRDIIMGGLGAALNFTASLATIMFGQALVADPNATDFSL